MKNQGIPHDQFDGRPVIGICNTWSQARPATPTSANWRSTARRRARSRRLSDGIPGDVPGRDADASDDDAVPQPGRMDVEESIRANPFDGVVLMIGCDKTTPSLLMGAASCDLPTIGISGGPMLNGKFRGADIGSGTHVWKFTEMLKPGEMKPADMLRSRRACRVRLAIA